MGRINNYLDDSDWPPSRAAAPAPAPNVGKSTRVAFEFPPLPPKVERSKTSVIYEELDPRLADYVMEPKTEASAGFDMRACIAEAMIIKAGDVVLIPTGVRVQCPFDDMVGFLLPRSGTGHKDGIILGNGTGVIDADFTGEIKMSIWNRSDKDFVVQPMDRLAQLVFLPRLRVAMVKGTVKEDYRRGSDGFGSSGLG